jgi:hypothetical protein
MDYGKKLLLISQEELDRLTKPKDPKPGWDSPNPCVQLYGPGPEGETCKHCALLLHFQQAASWYKCSLRKGKQGGLGGPSTDHKVRWPACAKFEKESHERR